MKQTLLILSTALFAISASAETTVTMTGVHNCCRSCKVGIEKAGASLKDVTITAEGKTVKIVAKQKSAAKKAVEAIIAAGYYGKVEGEESASKSSAASKPQSKVTKATVSGVHLCCQKCADAAIDAVKGVTKYDIASKATSFTVEGEFTKADLTAALNNAGFAGEIK
jgi:hypothetical protein